MARGGQDSGSRGEDSGRGGEGARLPISRVSGFLYGDPL